MAIPIIWSGKGLWTPVTVGCGLLLGGLAGSRVGSLTEITGAGPWVVGAILGLIPNALFGWSLNRNHSFGRGHSFYLIPIELWSGLFAVGLLVMIAKPEWRAQLPAVEARIRLGGTALGIDEKRKWDGVYAFAFSADSRTLVLFTYKSEVLRFDRRTAEQTGALDLGTKKPWSHKLLSSSGLVALIASEEGAAVYNTTNGHVIGRIQQANIERIAGSTTLERLVTWRRDKPNVYGKSEAIKIWSLPRGRLTMELETSGQSVSELDMSGDGHHVLVTWNLSGLAMFDAATGQIRWSKPELRGRTIFSEDSRQVLVLVDQHAMLVDVASGKTLWSASFDYLDRPSAAAFHGDTVIVGSSGGFVRGLRRSDGVVVSKPVRVGLSVTKLALSGDGETLAVVAPNGEIRNLKIWFFGELLGSK